MHGLWFPGQQRQAQENWGCCHPHHWVLSFEIKMSHREASIVHASSTRALALRFCLGRESGHKIEVWFLLKGTDFICKRVWKTSYWRVLSNTGDCGKRQSKIRRFVGDKTVDLLVCQRQNGKASWEEPFQGHNKSHTLILKTIPLKEFETDWISLRYSLCSRTLLKHCSNHTACGQGKKQPKEALPSLGDCGHTKPGPEGNIRVFTLLRGGETCMYNM